MIGQPTIRGVLEYPAKEYPIGEDQSFDLPCREAAIQGVRFTTRRVDSESVIGEPRVASMIETSEGEIDIETETERIVIENVVESIKIENTTGKNETKIMTAAKSQMNARGILPCTACGTRSLPPSLLRTLTKPIVPQCPRI